jgi:hypothetical protein
MSNDFPTIGRWALRACHKVRLFALLLVVVPTVAHAGDSSILQGQVDVAMTRQVAAAISEGYKIVTLSSEWRNGDGRLVSGGNSQLGWFLGDMLRVSKIKVRCIGLCFSSAAHILIASRGCVVGPHGRVALHMPAPADTTIGVSAYARARTDLIEEWRRRMASYDVPTDIVDRALTGRDGFHELSAYEMKRIGCTVE